MPYEARKYDQLIGAEGLSQKLLETHFTLYQGYVTNTNKLAELLGKLAGEGKTAAPEFAEVRRRFGWEFNGMRLHEYYFENINKAPQALDPKSKLALKIAQDFASLENWQKEFAASGAIRGIGWVVLTLDTKADRLFNIWINEHDVGFLAGTTPILVMDVFEHAFILDYGLKRADYINAFLKLIDWKAASGRFIGRAA